MAAARAWAQGTQFDAPEPADLPATLARVQIGPYQVQAELGRGGMGVVTQVIAPDGRSYALKRLRTESNTDDSLRLRRIDHPGVVRALDSGWRGGAFYVVMELIRGYSL